MKAYWMSAVLVAAGMLGARPAEARPPRPAPVHGAVRPPVAKAKSPRPPVVRPAPWRPKGGVQRKVVKRPPVAKRNAVVSGVRLLSRQRLRGMRNGLHHFHTTASGQRALVKVRDGRVAGVCCVDSSGKLRHAACVVRGGCVVFRCWDPRGCCWVCFSWPTGCCALTPTPPPPPDSGGDGTPGGDGGETGSGGDGGTEGGDGGTDGGDNGGNGGDGSD